MDEWVLNEMAFTVEKKKIIMVNQLISQTTRIYTVGKHALCGKWMRLFTYEHVLQWSRQAEHRTWALQNWISHKTLLQIKLVSLYWLKMADLEWLNGLRRFRATLLSFSAAFHHMLLNIHHRFGYRIRDETHACVCLILSYSNIRIDCNTRSFVSKKNLLVHSTTKNT